MTGSVSPPASRVRVVHGFQELAETRFADGINALCWRRTLPGDFAAVVACLGDGDGQAMTTLDAAALCALPLGPAGAIARDAMLADLHLLGGRDLAPALNCIYAYPRDDPARPIATDVFSFHVDSAPCEADTWLCTYHGRPSEGLANEDARRLVDVPATRAVLLAAYGGADDAGFADFLAENAYDLHYAALPQARPWSYGVGDLWRIATRHPGCPVPPGIHRAPPTEPGDPPRLLLIS